MRALQNKAFQTASASLKDELLISSVHFWHDIFCRWMVITTDNYRPPCEPWILETNGRLSHLVMCQEELLPHLVWHHTCAQQDMKCGAIYQPEYKAHANPFQTFHTLHLPTYSAAFKMTHWIQAIWNVAHLNCTQHPGYMDTLTDWDT